MEAIQTYSLLANSSPPYNLNNLKNSDIALRIIGIVGVIFASLLILPIMVFACVGTYDQVNKWIFELKHGQAVDSKVWNEINKQRKIVDPSSVKSDFNQAAFQTELTVQQKQFLCDSEVREKLEKNLSTLRQGTLAYCGYLTDLLMMNYLCEENHVYLNHRGYGIKGKGNNIADKICFTADIYDYDALKKLLEGEIRLHPEGRPAKILVPISLFPANREGHSILLVIEPDSKNLRKANITIVNTHGNAITSYLSYEKELLEMVKEVYNHPDTSAARNEKKTFTGGYCSIDCLENALHLATIPDVQAYIIAQKLPSRASEEIKTICHKHIGILEGFLEKHTSS